VDCSVQSMLRKPGHKVEKSLFLISLALMFSSIALAFMHFVDAFIFIFGLSFYLLLALFTYGNFSTWRKSRNTDKDMEIIGTSPDQVYETLLSFFSKKHGFNKMRVLHSSKPALIVVKLNSWIGIGYALDRPPGSAKLRIDPSDVGNKIEFRFDFSGFRNVMYGTACVLSTILLFQIFVAFHDIYGAPWLTLFGVIIILQMPFVSTLNAKKYLRGKIRACLTQSSRKNA